MLPTLIIGINMKIKFCTQIMNPKYLKHSYDTTDLWMSKLWKYYYNKLFAKSLNYLNKKEKQNLSKLNI